MKKIRSIRRLFAIVCLIAGCSAFGPEAPLEDGLFLSYDAAGSVISVTFEKINERQFQATVSPGGHQEVVNRRLRTTSGGVLEVDPLGPLWVPPSSIKVGGNAHGESVREVKQWERWDVGVVKVSLGTGGVFRGEWYYDKTTGFLVGGTKSTPAPEESGSSHFILRRTNLNGL